MTFSEAAAIEGIDDYRAVQVAGWYTRVPRRIAKLGPAVVLIDHVNKSAETKGQQAGSQHKKAGVDGSSLRVANIAPFAPGIEGSSMIYVGKDRAGGVRTHSVGGGSGEPMRFALFRVEAEGGFALDPPPAALSASASECAKEAKLRLDVSAAIAADGRALGSQNKVRQMLRDAGVKGNDATLNKEIKWLKEEGYIGEDFGHVKSFTVTSSGVE